MRSVFHIVRRHRLLQAPEPLIPGFRPSPAQGSRFPRSLRARPSLPSVILTGLAVAPIRRAPRSRSLVRSAVHRRLSVLATRSMPFFASQFTSTDGAATLPAPYTFKAADQGNHVFRITFGTRKSRQSLSVMDRANAAINGSESGIVVG